jgi:pentatricopeptide repeat protein
MHTHGILIHAYCKINRAALPARVFDKMLDAGFVPDKDTKVLLVKCLWKERKLREAAEVEDRCEDLDASGLSRCRVIHGPSAYYLKQNTSDLFRLFSRF